MKRFITTSLSALLLSPVLALAQEEQPVEVVEDPAAEAPAEAAAPAEGAPSEGDPALQQDMAAQEAPAEEEAEAEPLPGEGTGFIDAYWVPTTVADLGALDRENGDGMGARAQWQFWKFLAVSGEYTFRNYNDVDSDVTDTRFGVGASTRSNSGATGAVLVQYEKVSSDVDDANGYALHARWTHPATEWLHFHVDLGYGLLQGDADDYTTREANLGLLVKFGSAGIFADWRRTAYHGDDSNVESSVQDVRVGARLSFGD